MNCYTHGNRPAVGICAICQKAICHDCVGRDAPRLACRECVERSPVVLGFEYKSPATIGSWPLLHICAGIDPVTMRPTWSSAGSARARCHQAARQTHSG
jgi:hypothetical protein